MTLRYLYSGKEIVQPGCSPAQAFVLAIDREYASLRYQIVLAGLDLYEIVCPVSPRHIMHLEMLDPPRAHSCHAALTSQQSD